jgi:hypothetical protein
VSPHGPSSLLLMMVVDSGEISLSKFCIVARFNSVETFANTQFKITNWFVIRSKSRTESSIYLWIFLEIFVGEVVAEIEFDVALLERDLKIKIVASRTEAGFEISEEMESVCWHFPKASNRDCQYLFTLQEYWDYLGRLSTVVNPRKTLP